MTDATFIQARREAQRIKGIEAHAAYIRECGAEPFAVYRCNRIAKGQTPQNETPVAVRSSAAEAMDEANRIQRADHAHSYVVGLY